MTTFDETIRERKSLVPSARRRKCGSKSSFVGLPHDHLTPTQMRGMNGEVRTYQMKEPMNWSDFKALPYDLKQKYIDGITAEYNVNYEALAQMFGANGGAIKQYLSAMAKMIDEKGVPKKK